MLDFAWSELMVVIAVAVLVIGPKDIPKIMHGMGRVVRRLQYLKFALSQQFEDMLQAQDLDDMRRLGAAQKTPDTDEDAADRDMHDDSGEGDDAAKPRS